MNTVTTVTTAATVFSSFFSNKEEYLSFKAHWKVLANSKAITLRDAALRILALNQDAERSMPPTTNPLRLANGARYDCGLFKAMSGLNYEANLALKALKKLEQGGTPILSDFATRWAKHGLSLEGLASLEQRSNVNNFKGVL